MFQPSAFTVHNKSPLPLLISSAAEAPPPNMEGEECDTGLTLSVGGACAGGLVSTQFHALFPFHHHHHHHQQEEEEEEEEEDCSRKTIIAGGTRKKLRLSQEQQALLEDSFREHTFLAPKLKQELASRLNIQQRQVEVWFQNRKARNKLKQTEAELETLKKYRERLSEENRRLKREVEELRSTRRLGSPEPMATTLTICPACLRKTSCRAQPQRQGGTNGVST
ncbi:homeobox-leucine zipper protein HAT14 [Musa acuminata AAA Group]|uniref:homeobox-leucine zipper protein HAT14 n=1 Tax=Musa acuminata AAA Group TaxID=214697 RepID=UPI0031D38A49